MDPMDLFKTWQDVTVFQKENIKSSKEEIMEAIKSTSSSTLGQLKNRMKIKLGWIVLFLAMIVIWAILDHSNSEIVYIQGFLFVMFGLGIISLYPIYRKMDKHISSDMNTLSVMKSNLNLVRKALRRETIWGLVFIPIAAVIGYTLGQLYSGNTVTEILQDSKGLVLLLGISLILIPLANIGAYKMNQKAFGEFISELDENIVKMEAI